MILIVKMVNPNANTSSGSNATLDQTVSVNHNLKGPNAPKLMTADVPEYHKWKRYVCWWSEITIMPKSRHAMYIIMNCIVDAHIREVMHSLTDAAIK